MTTTIRFGSSETTLAVTIDCEDSCTLAEIAPLLNLKRLDWWVGPVPILVVLVNEDGRFPPLGPHEPIGSAKRFTVRRAGKQ